MELRVELRKFGEPAHGSKKEMQERLRQAKARSAKKRKAPEPAAASTAGQKKAKAAPSSVSPVAPAAGTSPVATPAASPGGEEDDEFVVEKIVKAGCGKQMGLFLVKWQGWPASVIRQQAAVA